MNRELIVIKNLIKYYRDSVACQVSDLTIYSGKRYAVVGPSGAGKTTFLRLCNRLVQPDEGRINYLDTKSAQGVMVFQKPNLFSGSVYYNLSYGLRLQEWSSNDIDQRVQEVATIVGLADSLQWHVHTLSAGEAQRVALARALAVKPHLLLLDEPTANLDPGNVKIIEEALSKAVDSWSLTVLLVTHNLAQAKRLAEEVIFFYNGQMQFEAPADIFFTQRLSREHTRFLEGEIVE